MNIRGMDVCFMKKRERDFIFIYIVLFIGAILQGIAMALFLFPHSIPSGGAAGLAILLNHYFGLSFGFSLWLVNAFCLMFALKYFGYGWTIKTVFSVAVTSTTVNGILAHLSLVHVHLLIEMIAGSFLFGIGVGLLIRFGASSGGMVIPALMISSYKKWSPGKVMLGINLMIFLITSVVIDYKIVAYAVFCQFISTNVIDFVHHFKLPYGKQLLLSWRK